MTKSEIIDMLSFERDRARERMLPHLANMDSQGQISLVGNYHSGTAAGLQLAINLVAQLDDAASITTRERGGADNG